MADNESILGVVIDPEKAESGSKRVNAALDRMESKGNDFARKFDSSISNTFNKFANTASTSFSKLQNSATRTFDNLTKSAKYGAIGLVMQYELAFKQIQAEVNKFNSSKSANTNPFDAMIRSAKSGAVGLIMQYDLVFKQIQDEINKNNIKLNKAATSGSAANPFDGMIKSAKSGAVGLFMQYDMAYKQVAASASNAWGNVSNSAAQSMATVNAHASKINQTMGPVWRQFVTGAQQSFNSAATSAKAGASVITDSFKLAWTGIKSGFNALFGGSGGSGGGGMFSGLGAWFAGAGIYLAIDKFIDKLVDANNTYNSFIATLHAGKMTGEQATQEYEYLLNLANSMGVEFSSLTRSYAKFTAATMDTALAGKAAMEVFESIVTVSTVLHSKGYDTERMFYAITQSISKGRIYREELVQQLAEKLPGAMSLAAKSMGMDIKQLNKALTDGTLDVSEFWLKFSQGLKQAYGGAAAEAAQMVEANINRLKNAVEVAFINIGQSGAIDGFINLLKALTTVINSATESSDYFGRTFGEAANMLAGWINSLSAQDIDSVIKGVSGIFDAFVRSIKVFVGAVEDIGTSKMTFIDFAEGVSSAMLTVAGIMIDTINLFKVLFAYMNKPVRPSKELSGSMFSRLKEQNPTWSDKQIENAITKENAAYKVKLAEYDKKLAERDKIIDESWETVGTGIANAGKQKDAMAKVYAKMREDNKKVSSTPFSALPAKDLVVPQALAPDEFNDLLAKIQGDPNYNNGQGKGDKAAARKAATEAKAVLRAYWNERENQIKQLAKLQIDQDNLLKNQNPLYEYNVRLEKEKIEADERLMKLAPEFKEKLLDNARAIDAQAIAFENLKSVMSDYMSTYQQIIANQDMIDQLNSGGLKQFTDEDQARRSTMFGGQNQYLTEQSKKQLIDQARARDNSNINVAYAQMSRDMSEQIIQMKQRNDLIGQGTFLTQLNSAAQAIDNEVRLKTIGMTKEQTDNFKSLAEAQKKLLELESFNGLKKTMEFDLDQQKRDLEFRNSLIGKTALEQAKLNEQYRIDNQIRLETKGMTDEQKKKYLELAAVIKNDLNVAIEDSFRIQRSALAGAQNAIAAYIDDITNYADQAGNTITNMFHNLEDALTEFLTTGKLSLKDFFAQLKQDLARTFVKEIIMGPITSIFKEIVSGTIGGGSSSGGGSGSGSGSGSSSGGSVTGSQGIWGNIKSFFSATNGSGTLQQNLLGSIGSMIGKVGSLLGSAAISQFASSFAGKAVGTLVGQGPTVAGSATGLGSLAGSTWAAAGKFVATYGGYISAGIQALSGDLKGAAWTAAGAAIGSVIPGVGTIIGGMVGGIVGGLFGGKAKTKKYSSAEYGTYVNGEFTSRRVNGSSGYGRALGANDGMISVMENYSKLVGGLMKAYDLGDNVNTRMQMYQRVSSKVRAWGYFNASAGGGKTSISQPNSYRGANAAQAAFDNLVEQIFTKGIKQVVATSQLPEGVKMLFEGLTDKDQIQSMVIASISLAEAQDVLADRYGLTADTAGKVAVATGLAGQELIDFTNVLVNTALTSQTVGDAMIRQRDILQELIGGHQLTNVNDFDGYLKSIDTSTLEGQQKFADYFQQRDNVINWLKSFGEIKSNLDSVLYDMMTPGEQLAYNQEKLSDIFDELNMAVPQSRDELKSWLQNLDLSTAAGLNAASAASTIAELFGLITDDLTAAASQLSADYFSTYSDYYSAYNAVRNGDSPTPYIQSQSELIAELITEMQSLKDDNVTTQAYLRALSVNSAKQQQILDGWDRQGMPVERED